METFTAGAITTAEWSKILLSGLENYDTIGAEYYALAYVEAAQALQSTVWPLRPLSEVCSLITDGLHGKTDYLDEGVVFVLSECVKEGHIDLGPSRRISQEMHNSLQRSKLKPGDVLVTKTGVYFGRSAVVPESLPESNTIAHVARLVPGPKTNPFFLSLFLNTFLGQFQLRRRGIKGTRPEIKLIEFQDILVPIPPMNVQQAAEAAYRAAEKTWERARSLYTEAETQLLTELGLDDLDLSHQIIYTQSFSQTWTSNRLDAEYYQPKYYKVLDALRSLGPKEMLPLDEMLTTITNGHTPRRHDLSVGQILFLTAEFVDDFRIDYDGDKRILREHHENELQRTALREEDLLITIKGRIGNAAVVAHLPGKTNINQDVALLRLKRDYHPYYVAAFLNSPAGKALTEQVCTGQINPFLGLGNLKQVPVPIFDPGWMNELGDEVQKLVESACHAEQESKRLLEEAKQRVETMVLGE